VHEEVDSSQFTVNGRRRKRLIDWKRERTDFNTVGTEITEGRREETLGLRHGRRAID
jgi:hypothetical protein